MEVKRLLIADDHEIFRDGLRLMLSKQADICLVGEAENGRQLVTLAESLEPDVILTDIKMPLLDGIEATRELVARRPGIRIIALSMFDEEHLIVDMMEAGARGYLLKNADKTEILEAVQVVFENGTYYCHRTSSRLASLLSKSRFQQPGRQEIPAFTDRETEIIRLICKQFTAQEIADKVFLSKRTVEGHRARILEKMDVKNTAGIVIYALRNNIISEAEVM